MREEVKESIEYEHLRQELPYNDVESLLKLIVDVMSSTASTMRIGGEVLPVDAVRRRFRQLDSEHIKYVIGSLRQTTTKINNIRVYGAASILALLLGPDKEIVLHLLRLEAVVKEFAKYSTAMVFALIALGKITFLVFDQLLGRMTCAYRKKRKA